MAVNHYYQGPVTDHFDGKRFHGPGEIVDKSIRDLLRLYRTKFAEWPRHVENPPASPVEPHVDGCRLKVTTLGHASLLLQTRGLNILIDPVWSDRASPFSFAGPRRVAEPGLALAALPPIHIVLITHNHYDHLDPKTLATLQTMFGCRIIAPLGNDAIVLRHDRSVRVEPYDWGDRIAFSNEVSATLTPCHHWSARWLGDRRMALWAAYVIETPDGAIYHIGDTAYRDGSLFRAIPQRFGAPRLAIIPIGAYAPRWFMRDHHVDPSESVAVLQDCKAKFALAHHWGTFRLTAEPIDAPPQRLAQALEAAGIAKELFRVQRPGEAFDVPSG